VVTLLILIILENVINLEACDEDNDNDELDVHCGLKVIIFIENVK
jgi:hypothetical protein